MVFRIFANCQKSLPGSLALIFLAVSAPAAVWPEKFDIASYAAPAGWQRQASASAIEFSNKDEAAGRFCIMTLYKSRAGSGDIDSDFRTEWRDKVNSRFPNTPAPKNETAPSPTGTEVSVGGGKVNFAGVEIAAILAIYRGGRRVISVLTLMNDGKCQEPFEKFLMSIKLTEPGQASLQEFSGRDKGRPPADGVVGTWTDVSSGDFAVRSTGGTVSTGRGGSGRGFTFRADSNYEYSFLADAVMTGSRIFIHETGTYKVSGDAITLTAKTKLYRKDGLDHRSTPNESRAYRWRIEREGRVVYLVLTKDGFADRLRLDGR